MSVFHWAIELSTNGDFFQDPFVLKINENQYHSLDLGNHHQKYIHYKKVLVESNLKLGQTGAGKRKRGMEVEKTSTLDNKKDDDEEVVLPGFRFHPTDEELVGFYLRRKVEKKPISLELIKQVDIYKYDPWDLPSKL